MGDPLSGPLLLGSRQRMQLCEEHEIILEGRKGPGAQKAMEILAAYGKCYQAERMIPITSVHIAGNFPVLMDEGVEWLEDLAREETKVRVFTTKNPEMYDSELADELKIPDYYRVRQRRIHEALKSLGIALTYTCHHYLVGNVPRFGDHIAWASSGSQVFANSVIGARSNRDGDHVALAAAIIGAIPEWGLHLQENRKGQVLIDVGGLDTKNYDSTDFKALGWCLGKQIGSKIPVFTNLPPDLNIEAIKGLLYSLTVTGATGTRSPRGNYAGGGLSRSGLSRETARSGMGAGPIGCSAGFSGDLFRLGRKGGHGHLRLSPMQHPGGPGNRGHVGRKEAPS
jgi:predicted aconitase